METHVEETHILLFSMVVGSNVILQRIVFLDKVKMIFLFKKHSIVTLHIEVQLHKHAGTKRENVL